MLFSETKKAGGAGLQEDDVFRFGRVQLNVLWDTELWKQTICVPILAPQFQVI